MAWWELVKIHLEVGWENNKDAEKKAMRLPFLPCGWHNLTQRFAGRPPNWSHATSKSVYARWKDINRCAPGAPVTLKISIIVVAAQPVACGTHAAFAM
jgi:hypothetical protein